MMSPTVDLPIVVEVNKIYQELIAGGACEARGVPNLARSCPGGEHHHLPAAEVLPALMENKTTFK